VPSYYKLCAISNAVGILRNYRKAFRKNPSIGTPYAEKLILTTCYGFKIEGDVLRLPIGKRRYEEIPLNSHTKSVLSVPGHTSRSVFLNARAISIAFTKETVEMNPRGLIGIDRNLDNITVASSSGDVKRLDLSRATEIKATYREVKSHFTRNDVRIGRRIFGKYGVKQRNKVGQILHHVSREVVDQAKARNFGIVMENLKGLRKLYRRGNGQGNKYRSRLNSWSFYELQRQIQYKARWDGIPVVYIPPQRTSSTCAMCGSDVT